MENAAVSTSHSQTTAITNFSIHPHRRQSKTIRDLPTEVLFIIFRLIYHDIYGHLLPRNRDQSRLERQLERDRDRLRPDRDQWVTSCSMFPHAIASTCPAWRNIMLSVPEFWERLVILIDSPSTSLLTVISHTWWSREKPLDVTITRRWDSDDPIDGRQERSWIIAILHALRSHLHLIQELQIDVTFSSSLPSFPSEFRGSATTLEHLTLRCREDDGGPDHSTPIDISIFEEFKCPRLVSLVIDGRNYYEAYRLDVEWMTRISHITDLTISRFAPRPGESFSSYEILLPVSFADVDTLRITDVRLDPSPEGLQIDLPLMGFLEFEDMHVCRTMDQITALVDPYEVCFIRCTFEHLAHPFRRFGNPDFGARLALEEIDHDIAPLIRLWDGRQLHVTRCLNFDDTVLDMITESVENGIPTCARYLESITLIDCPNFSIAALQRLIESRRHLSDDGDDDWGDIQFISLSGDVPPISEADEGWFRRNLEEFKYNEESR